MQPNRRGRIYLANVGANARHQPLGLVSPLAADGSFTLVPIPEQQDLPGMVRYGDIAPLRAVVPERYWGRTAHLDPEFETLTYGDNCGWAPRAVGLKSCRPGDYIFFIARLSGPAGPVFALVGCLEVEDVLRDARGPLSGSTLERFRANAHVRRAQADAAYWDGFWVFGGGPGSRLFDRAVVIGRREACDLFRNRDGGAWDWRAERSDLQTIGSYTRSCRCIIDPAEDPGRAAAWWALLWERVGLAPWQSH